MNRLCTAWLVYRHVVRIITHRIAIPHTYAHTYVHAHSLTPKPRHCLLVEFIGLTLPFHIFIAIAFSLWHEIRKSNYVLMFGLSIVCLDSTRLEAIERKKATAAATTTKQQSNNNSRSNAIDKIFWKSRERLPTHNYCLFIASYSILAFCDCSLKFRHFFFKRFLFLLLFTSSPSPSSPSSSSSTS